MVVIVVVVVVVVAVAVAVAVVVAVAAVAVVVVVVVAVAVAVVVVVVFVVVVGGFSPMLHTRLSVCQQARRATNQQTAREAGSDVDARKPLEAAGPEGTARSWRFTTAVAFSLVRASHHPFLVVSTALALDGAVSLRLGVAAHRRP